MVDKEEERKSDGKKHLFTFCVLHLKDAVNKSDYDCRMEG
jgi:hypothetical protein